jgi:outer membrane protein assembly factor BamB
VSGGLVQPLTDQRRYLEALDPASGRTRWQRTMSAYGGLEPAGGMLLLTGADGTVTGVDSASGATKWKRRIPGQGVPYFVSFTGDRLAYATSTSDGGSTTQVTAVEPSTGEVRWDARLKGTLKPVGAEGGSVYFLSGDDAAGTTKAVVRYIPESEATRRVALPVPPVDARATVRGDVVYLLAAGGSLEAVDMAARKRLWKLETSVSRGSAPVSDGRHVYVTAPDGRLLAADARTGAFLGQTPPRLGANSGQVTAALLEPMVADGRVYAGAPDGTVFAVDGRDPSRW